MAELLGALCSYFLSGSSRGDGARRGYSGHNYSLKWEDGAFLAFDEPLFFDQGMCNYESD